jgi:dihydroorotate dehydrogenase (fumarate)
MVGASPLTGNLDAIKRLEDAGSAAVVMHSLFEEQITLETRGEIRHRDVLDSRFASIAGPFPTLDRYALTVDGYLNLIRQAREAVSIPNIASMNGSTTEAWLRVAKEAEAAGAQALEVNFYDVHAAPNRSSAAVETELRDVVVELKRLLRIPLAMKLSPFFTALGNLASRLDSAGVDGFVLFNRFYQPDIDTETQTVITVPELSTSAELRLRLPWVALLKPRVTASIAVTGGVATVDDGIKALLAGADAVQMVSAVLRHGLGHLDVMREGLEQYLAAHGFANVADIKGRVTFGVSADPGAFQRASYIHALQHRDKAGNAITR